MSYEWDEVKAKRNLRDHGVDFADAATVFEDDRALTTSDDGSGEERFVTLGLDALGRHLVVVYTWRTEQLRIISARTASKAERRRYEEGI
ncbi:MAG: BrnT family toxin [Lysobacterales bacterium]|nr:MAG: BrnT family toxin [Xanthomonadales bacterium]